ncbi:hypothetical protein TPHA_0O01520 [Tetrapisispora phaffii CBS 4417]|uniref:Aminotransferase class I/classII large domain-containing protein n=1 Tax=Tetrapisispora phaffii (strain ATCC 24235 / CBS 4417 / NBRC 1672 / NRRL Y-8282 / UCD 70-5) TaxID=1071381 RepID=G8C1U1_TETPH|nr:hypothetical protein TPHA_0O01520 [Tetrapisispora phaffii CBS 4417]CCE66119.1 hypothetical protein TPHA_0O01520 [Tetrapisispora phaffii CBS 4417]
MTNHISNEELEQKFSSKLSRRAALRKLIPFWDDLEENPEDLIELAGGMPNPKLFPVNSIDFNIVNKPQFGDVKTEKASIGLYEPKTFPMARSFQYMESKGPPAVINFAKSIIERINKPKYDNWDLTLASGSSDGMFKIFETLLDENSSILMEEFTFTPAAFVAIATGASCIPLKMKLSENAAEQGIDIDYMANLLDNWETSQFKDKPKPKMLYTIATGQNPTGMTLSMEKRRKIYEICQKHDIIILEDDPYGYLLFPKYDPSNPYKNSYVDDKELTVATYLDEYLVKSFLTLDTDGRVLRLETFSKVFAPGLRLSFIVGNSFLIEKFVDFADVSSRSPSGTSQAILLATVNKFTEPYLEQFDGDYTKASLEGWFKWVMSLASMYTHRRNVLVTSLRATEAFKKGYMTILEPSAGMFIDIKLQCENIEKLKGKDVITIMDELNSKLLANRIKIVLGYKMALMKEFSKDHCDFLRVTIAYAEDDEQLAKAAQRIGDGIVEYLETK